MKAQDPSEDWSSHVLVAEGMRNLAWCGATLYQPDHGFSESLVAQATQQLVNPLNDFPVHGPELLVSSGYEAMARPG